MRTLTDTQFQHTAAVGKQPIWVAEIMFTNGLAVEGVNDFYFASQSIDALTDGAIKPLPAANKWYPYLDPLSVPSISQKVDVMTGVSTIGNLSFNVIDVDKKVSAIIQAADSYVDAAASNVGYGLNRQFIDLYIIYAGDNWDDRQKVRRMQVSSVTLNNGTYQFNCEDIQRAARTTFAEPHTGSLLTAMTTTTTLIAVGNTEVNAFPFNLGMSYIRIGDEIMKVTARTELSKQINLTVVRAQANTVAAAHKKNDDVSEVVRFYGDPLDVAIQVLTGYVAFQNGYWTTQQVDRYDYRAFTADSTNQAYPRIDVPVGSPAPAYPAIPSYITNGMMVLLSVKLNLTIDLIVNSKPSIILTSHWHCGMSIDFHIDQAEWDKVRMAANTPASPFEFWLNKGEDGKLFVEREIMQVLGLFMRVKGDGRIGISAYNDLADAAIGIGVGIDAKSNGDYRNLVLDEEVIVKHGKVEIVRKGDLMTKLTLQYDPLPKIKGTMRRTSNFVDVDAFRKHGAGRSFTV
ncbi:MAG: hypothetical protein Q9N02_11510, partial [Ghiorsea sp.]|nr:hypothetical protein [Ghiorsea sp.]